MDRDILLLKIRSAIADKEFAIARANMELYARGEWSCDWHQEYMRADNHVDGLMQLLEV